MEHLNLEQFKNYQDMVNVLNAADQITAVDYGDVAVLYKLAERIGLVDIINRHTNKREQGVQVGQSAVALAINRCCDPKSKRAFPDWYKNSYLPQLLGVSSEDTNSTLVTRSLDYLSEEEVQLEIFVDITTCLMQKFALSLDGLFYDITSTYFEGNKCGMAEHGYSRDHRPDKKQINIELVVSRKHQFPLLSRSFNGSVSDVKRFGTTLGTIKNIYPELKVTLIGDQGCCSRKNVELTFEHKQDFIFGAGPTRLGIDVKTIDSKQFTAFSLEELERLNWRDKEYEQYQFYKEFIDVSGNTCCVIYYFNPKKAEQDKKTRERFLKKIEEKISLLKEKIKNGDYGLKTKAGIKKRVKKILEKSPFIYKIEQTIQGFSLKVERDYKRIELEALADGRFALVTSHLKRSPESILKDYRDKDGIEKAFRTIKGQIEIRPIWHYKPERVSAHVFICTLGYLLIQLLEYLLKVDVKVNISSQSLIEQLHRVKVVCYEFGQNRLYQRTTIVDSLTTIFDFLQLQFTGGP